MDTTKFDDYIKHKYQKEMREFKQILDTQMLFKQKIDNGEICTVNETPGEHFGEEYSTIDLYKALLIQAKIYTEFFK